MKSGGGDGGVAMTPVLVVEGVEEEAAFLRAVFQAEIGMLMHNAQGDVQHAEASIGRSVLILERASPTVPATRSAMRILIKNVEAALEAALENGGERAGAPSSGPAGHGEAAVSDPQGNIWWMVPAERKPSNQEVQRRLIEQRRQRL